MKLAKGTSYKGPVRVVQISDSHLFEDKAGCLLGMNTEQSFQSVVGLVEDEQPKVDLVLATGDIAQDASEAAYQRFSRRVKQLGAPVYWLPGNHDVKSTMAKVVGDQDYLSPTVAELGNWSIVLLNSAIPGEVPGALAQSELDYLERALQARSDRNIMVTLHHHPIDLGSDWLDGVALKNPGPFWDIVVKSEAVKTVVWGHVHQTYDQVHYGKRCLALPSTCIQFKPKSSKFAVDDEPPGYRWFDLHSDGRIETGVSRVRDQVFTVDLNGTGY